MTNRGVNAVEFSLPRMITANDAAQAAAAVVKAVSLRELTPAEGSQVMGLLDAFRRTLEVT